MQFIAFILISFVISNPPSPSRIGNIFKGVLPKTRPHVSSEELSSLGGSRHNLSPLLAEGDSRPFVGRKDSEGLFVDPLAPMDAFPPAFITVETTKKQKLGFRKFFAARSDAKVTKNQSPVELEGEHPFDEVDEHLYTPLNDLKKTRRRGWNRRKVAAAAVIGGGSVVAAGVGLHKLQNRKNQNIPVSTDTLSPTMVG
jgi:hypothetical protein